MTTRTSRAGGPIAARTAASWPGRKASKPKRVCKARAGSMSAADSTAHRGRDRLAAQTCCEPCAVLSHVHPVSLDRYSGSVPVHFIFRCQFCDAQPDPMTQLSLEAAMRENTWGAYQNALPGRWLVFHARGLYGSPRYACPEHRGDLVAYLRQHFGTIGFHVWKRPPYPSS